MAKGYEDLSRKALIKLNKDFDKKSGGELHKFLSENDDKYEEITPVELFAESISDAVESIGFTAADILSDFINSDPKTTKFAKRIINSCLESKEEKINA